MKGGKGKLTRPKGSTALQIYSPHRGTARAQQLGSEYESTLCFHARRSKGVLWLCIISAAVAARPPVGSHSLTRSLTLALSAMVGPQGDRCASAAPSGIVHNGLDAFPALVPLDKDPPAMIRAGFQGCGTFKYGYGGSCATLVLVGTRGGEKGAIGGNQQQRNKRQYWGITTWNSRYAMDCIWLFRGPTPLPLLSGGSGGSIATVDQRMTLIS